MKIDDDLSNLNEKSLNDLAIRLVKEQGLQFATYQEAQAKIQQTVTYLRTLLQRGRAFYIEGLKYLSEKTQYPAAEIASQLLKNVDAYRETAEIIETNIVNDIYSLEKFSDAVNSFYDCGDYHVEECVISVLLTLFPMEPQPFACYGTLIWRKDSISDAETFYRSIVDIFENPILDYFSADCFAKSGKREDAKKLLKRALRNAQGQSEIYDKIIPLIRVALNTI
jgi:tetratricopeptide (TPR) repeat protein